MPHDAPTTEDILQAIKATGFLMEQRVATCLEALGFYAWTGYPFEDPEQSKSREIDVRGYRQIIQNANRLLVEIELLCECKSNEHPFVFITRTKGGHDKRRFWPVQYVLPYDQYEVRSDKVVKSVSGFRHFDFYKYHYYDQQEQKAVQFCKIVRDKNRWEANQGGIYDAIFYPLAKAVLARKKASEVVRRPSSRDGCVTISLIMPIVVLHGKLFNIDSMTEDLVVTETSHITFVRDLTSKIVSGQFLIDFTTEDGLEDFVKTKVMPFAEKIADAALRVRDELAKFK